MQVEKKQLLIEPTDMPEKKQWYEDPALKAILRGLITTLPVIILLFLLSLALQLVLNIISPISKLIWVGSQEPSWLAHLVAVFILIGFFYAVGKIGQGQLGKTYFRYIEKNYLNPVPLYTTLRDLVRQFAGVKEMPFKQVVLVDPFDSGVLMTGFVTEKINEDLYTVFVPTAPNPTNGNIYHVPKSRLHLVTNKADEAMRTVVGMGTGSKCFFDENISCKNIDTADGIAL